MKYLEKYDNYPYKKGQYVKTIQKYCVDDINIPWNWDNKFKVLDNKVIIDSTGKIYGEKFLLESWCGFTIWLTSSDIDRFMTDKEIEKFKFKKTANQYNL